MNVKAKIKYLKISARKLRLDADLIRGKRVLDAENVLAATPRKGSVMVASALKSAIANAENNHNQRKNTLFVSEIRVDEGPALKRVRPRSRGSAHPIEHRMAHLTVVVAPAPEKAVAKPSKSTKTVKETK
ncbi:50S ribosomal protein L22 [Candidatus Saccharibacteria bacterium]|nr:50S ribosomal protein L22 [Candidatus Saccharibacteria bacterium]